MKKAVSIALTAALMVPWPAAPATVPHIENPELFGKSQMAAQQAVLFYGNYDNPKELERIIEIGYRIAQESNFDDFPLTFYLVNMPEPNAFALPGGQVFMTKGMLDLGLNDDMLAGLLGHEIGHVVLQHGTKMQRRATLLNVLSQALLAGVLIAATQGSSNSGGTVYDPYNRGSNTGDIIQGTAAAGAVISELLLRSYSREFEDEADDEGQRLAAAAGFDPDGTRQLMDKMRSHIPQSKDYGYWRTHPFFEERVQAASVREDLLKIQEPSSADAYRKATQDVLLAYIEEPKVEPEIIELLKLEALLAWPQGPKADAIRIEKLRRLRDNELAKSTLSQDYSKLIRVFKESIETVSRVTPDSELLAALESEIEKFEALREQTRPTAVETFEGGIFEVEFLRIFLNNYPDAEQSPEVALALGNAYSRLRREADAVEQYLNVRELSPDSPQGQSAAAGLKNLAPMLEQLGALEQLTKQDFDPELAQLASTRLEQMASRYDELANGADYLRHYPDGERADAVEIRLNELADKLYGELILYQTVGDTVKGIERIQKILTYAPNSPAAEKLRDRMVLEG